MKTARDVKRAARTTRRVPSVALAGYTNAGKSSLLNRLAGTDVLVDNALFVTLDPTVRRAETADGREFTVADTVGFVRHLPHQLIEAFRSTLEEVAASDLILHVVDAADSDPIAQIDAVRVVLTEIDALSVPEQLVFNKIDAVDDVTLTDLRRRHPGALFVSARTGAGIAHLHDVIADRLPRPDIELQVLLPYTRGDLLAQIHAVGEVLEIRHTEDGSAVTVRVNADLAAVLASFSATPATVRRTLATEGTP